MQRERLNLSPTMVYPLLDWFIPADVKRDREVRQRARMFLVSHIFGPFLGQTITGYLVWVDPGLSPAWWVLEVSLAIFWAYPWALRWTGKYTPLALLSVQNLIFCILWGCYHYGGMSSPFLPWLLTVPLLAFFYLGPAPRLRFFVLCLIAVNLCVFYAAYAYNDGFPTHVPLSSLSGIGIVSTLCASVYVSMMALYYASIVASQSELEREVHSHRATAIQLLAAKEEAERADQAKSEFLAKMSHELRTPLNAVIGYSEILLEDAEQEPAAEQQIADLQKINSAGKHLLMLVSDVLDLSKIEAGKMEIFTEHFGLGGLIDSVAATSEPLMAKNANELIIERDVDLGLVETDATKLRQALLNVLSNAAKFTKNGLVTVTVRRDRRKEGDWISIAVRDTGIGISQANLPRLFHNFSQVDPSTSNKYGGTGLGLALTQKLCRLIGGEITVESELGRGTCFTIRIPASLANTVQQRTEGGRIAATQIDLSSDQKVVLLIDDDPAALDLIQRILSKEGYQPILASDGQEGLALAKAITPSAIILDVLMPAIDGWEVLRMLKSDPETESCPVVLLTVVDDRKKGLALGAAEHLVKPIDRDVLVRVLDGICSRGDNRGQGGAERRIAPAGERGASPATSDSMAANG